MKKGFLTGQNVKESGKHEASEVKYSIRTLQDNLDNLAHLQHEHRQRLQVVEEEYAQLTKFRDDYLHLQKRLKTLPDKTSHEVMVPFGPLAFMPGRLIHTNEMLVLLGDNWFAERSTKEAIEIVKRRVKDCNEKISTVEGQKNVHLNWLKETSGLFEEGEGQVEIVEELTEEEFEKSKEEHRKKVAERHGKNVPENPEAEVVPSDDGASTSQENFMNKLNESDKKAYEDVMRRLDQLELEEDEESVGSQDTVDYDRADVKNLESTKEETYDASGGADLTEAIEEESTKLSVKAKKKLKRRVSWADDMRPLHTVIPDEESDSIYRIKYSTKQLSLPLFEYDVTTQETFEETASEEIDTAGAAAPDIIQSPSDIYKVFGPRRSSLQDPPPRSILKKTFSNPESHSDAQSGWRCEPEINSDSGDDLLPTEPSEISSPQDKESLEPAFSYKIVERKMDDVDAEASQMATSPLSSDTQTKKVSRFKASRMKK